MVDLNQERPIDGGFQPTACGVLAQTPCSEILRLYGIEPQHRHTVALLRTMAEGTDGAAALPSITVTGGTLLGIPVLASAACPPTIIALVDASQILLAYDGVLTLDV